MTPLLALASTPHFGPARRRSLAWATAVAALLAGCATPLPPDTTQPPLVQPPVTPAPASTATPAATPPAPAAVSRAQTAREYRADAAAHLYAKNSQRIFKGKLPPLLYAVGVLQVHVDGQGNVSGLSWMRAPNHAPEVVAEIERTVRNAAPYPVAVKLGKVTYTDTWLWDRSGQFQLDTLTEGQLGEMPARAAPAKTEAQAKKAAPAKKPGGTTQMAERHCAPSTANC